MNLAYPASRSRPDRTSKPSSYETAIISLEGGGRERVFDGLKASLGDATIVASRLRHESTNRETERQRQGFDQNGPNSALHRSVLDRSTGRRSSSMLCLV